MADNNFVFKVLAELSDTEYFTFHFFPLTRVGGQALSGKFHYLFYFFKTLPKSDSEKLKLMDHSFRNMVSVA